MNKYTLIRVVTVALITSLLFACKQKEYRKPMFNGDTSEVEFLKYVYSKTIYPEEALIEGISGRVVVEFVIDANGFLTDATIKHSVHPLLDAEALRVVNSSPKWEPGIQKGKPVKVKFVFPIKFTITDEQYKSVVDSSDTYTTRRYNKTERIETTYDVVASKNPFVNELYNKGSQYAVEENYTKAKTYFLKVLAIEPNNIEALNVLGFIETRLHNFESSIEYLTKAIKIDPAFPWPYMNLGITHYYNHSYEEGVLVLKSMDYSKMNKTVLFSNYYHLFMNYTGLNNRDSAFFYYQSAIRECENELMKENIENFKREFFDIKTLK